MKNRNQTIGISLILIFLTLSVLQMIYLENSNDIIEKSDTKNADEKDKYSLIKSSGFYYESFIHITGANWTETLTKPWCSGFGNSTHPYLIENVTITGGPLSGIFIENSEVNFIIRNVTIYNMPENGIFLDNTNNATITNNTLYNNNFYGIWLDNSNKSKIFENNVYDNNDDGIHLRDCVNATVYNNFVKNNRLFGASGIYIRRSVNINISFNIVEDNEDNGIYAVDSSYLDIIGNQIEDNDISGVNFVSTNNSIITDNSLINNITESNSVNNFIIMNKINGTYGPVIIDETGNGNFTWSQATIYSWVSGFGTLGNPYVIENITIDGGVLSSCIEVKNSRKYFEIRNSNFTNSKAGAGVYGGIVLSNVTNGFLIENNVSANNDIGIFLSLTNNTIIHQNIASHNLAGVFLNIDNYNNTISNNIIYNNSLHGILMGERNKNNTVSTNQIRYNSQSGIHILANSDNNNFSLNYLEENKRGLLLGISSNNTISKNIINQNIDYGVYIGDIGCEDNLLYDNNFTNNGIANAYDSGADTMWNNTYMGNFWSNYTELGSDAVDANDDGIGDIPYTIYDTVNSKDYLPIYDDGHDGNPILIDNTNTNSWKWFSRTSWVNGNGTPSDPYIIKNLVIDGENFTSSITIENSNVIFIIENNTLFNSSSGSGINTGAGVKLINVNNGTLVNNNCSYNNGNGIFLINSNNITIMNNTINFNKHSGIVLNNSNHITISKNNNTINNNNFFGI